MVTAAVILVFNVSSVSVMNSAALPAFIECIISSIERSSLCVDEVIAEVESVESAEALPTEEDE